jgi:Spy/CpxP family protein refolding chaperone
MELHELMAAEKPDRAQIDKKLEQLSEVQLAARKAAIEQRLAMREMITPEQRQKMQEMFRQQRRGPMGPPDA